MEDKDRTVMAVSKQTRDEYKELKKVTGLPIQLLAELSVEPLKKILIRKGLLNENY